MSEQAFTYDVLPIHSAKDKPVVRPLAERLRADGLTVWFDEWEAPSAAGAGEGGRRPGEGRVAHADSIPAKIEDGLEHSRVLPLAHRRERVPEGQVRVACRPMRSRRTARNWAVPP